MADLAIGISKTAVETLVKKFQEAVQEEKEQWQTVMKDFIFITDEFEMMQSFFFSAADGDPRVKSNVVSTWVMQVRDLSYDAEDWIEYVKHLDTNPASRRCAFMLRMIPGCCKSGKAQPLDNAVDQITLLKARVEEVRLRNLRYNLISDSSGSSERPAASAAASVVEMAAGNTRKLDVLIKATDDTNEPRGFLSLTWLIKQKGSTGLQVMSVWGTEDDAGVAATIKEAYGDPEICAEFRCAWVRLMHPFNPHEFMQSVLTQFYTNSPREQKSLDPDVLKARVVFVQQVNEKKYLIVLEDISSMEQWHAVRMYLPHNTNGSRIVVSTQHLDIARSCAGHRYQALEIKQFSDNHSVWVLKKVVQRGYFEDSFRLIGRSSEGDQLFNLLKTSGANPNYGIYSVWGLAGVGKSALIKTVYARCKSPSTDQQRLDYCYSKCAWVNVPHPFHLKAFCKIILDNLSARPKSHASPTDPIEPECRRLLDEKNLLLVIDGVQSKEDWNSINSNLLIREPGSGERRNFIIVTTTVGLYPTFGNVLCHYIRGLREDLALELFNKVLWETATILKRDMLEEAQRILPHCRGLPRVIVGMATHLARLFCGNRVTLTRELEWRCLCANITHLETSGTEHDNDLPALFTRMHSSFNTCSPLLKKFILYLLVFPGETTIRLRRLVRRWVAEGFFQGNDSRSLEVEAGDFIRKLAAADMSVIQAPQESTAAGDMRMTSCQVNPFFFRYFISRLKEESTVLPLEVSVLANLKKTKQKQQKVYNLLGQDGNKAKTSRIGVHLTVRSDWERDRSVFDQLNLKRLRSLTVSGKWEQFFISADRMAVLRVLDLENAPSITDDDLRKIGKLPPRLKFISLRGCKNISSLQPDTLDLSDLTQLQTLDIRGTAIIEIPKSIIKLRELEYISAGPLKRKDDDDGSINGGVKVPRGIMHLASLKTLGVVDIAASGKAILKEICLLHGLKKLKVSGIKQANSSSLRQALSCLTNLESLSLRLQKENNSHRRVLRRLPWDDISPPSTVRSLKLHGHVQELPRNLGHLTRLNLDMTTVFTEAVIKVLGSLTDLRALHLRVTRSEHGVLHFPADVLFSQLQNLQITCRSILHVRFDVEAMKTVELLMVHCFGGSSLQFSGLHNLTSLKQFWLDGTCRSDDTLREALQQQLGQHANKPTLKMETPVWHKFWSI